MGQIGSMQLHRRFEGKKSPVCWKEGASGVWFGLWGWEGAPTMGVSAPAHSLDSTVQGLYPSDPKDIPDLHHPGSCPDLHQALGKGNGVIVVSCGLPQMAVR